MGNSTESPISMGMLLLLDLWLLCSKIGYSIFLCISMVQRWAQELLGYTFSVVLRPNQMMCDVDSLSRWYGKLSGAHLCISNILHNRDKRHRSQVYQQDNFISSQKSKMNIEGIEIETCPIFTEHNIFESDIFNPYNNLDDISSPKLILPKYQSSLLNQWSSSHGLML